MEVGKELAKVLSGGDTTLEKTLSEDDLYKLELDAFMKLIETEKTQERIKHTLKTGKPLVNYIMANRPTKKQSDNATKILISWKKKMPFYYAAAIIIALIIILVSSNSNKEVSMYQKNINDFKKAAEFIHRNSSKN
jgi:hypothetical protein